MRLTSLILILRIFGWLGIILGTITLLALLLRLAVKIDLTGVIMGVIIGVIICFLPGIFYLVLASGLSKKKKWAWYLGVIFFICVVIAGFLFTILEGIVFGLEGIVAGFGGTVVGIIFLLFLQPLLKEKKAFFEAPESPDDASKKDRKQ